MIIIKIFWWTGLVYLIFRALIKNQWEVGGHYDRYKEFKKGEISKEVYYKDLLIFFITWLWCLSALYFATTNDILGVFSFK